MARHENNRNQSRPYGYNLNRNYAPVDDETEDGDETGSSHPDSDKAWRRVDNQREGHKYFGGERHYSGYYGDANRYEEQGKNRFRSGRPAEYQDNRWLDNDDNFIDEEVSSGGTRNIGTNPSWKIRNETTFPNRGVYYGKGPKNYKRSDERIREEANDVLYRSHKVDASDIEVDVKDAVVILKGSVDSRESKREAEYCVENVPGVFDVRNELKIRSRK